MADNLNLNINPARTDKFFLSFGDIPSIPLLTPSDLQEAERIHLVNQEKNFFHLGLKNANIPGVSLGEVNIGATNVNLPDVNDKFTFEKFSTEIKIDNNFLIYKMLLLWMYLINRPDEYNQFSAKKTFELTTVTAFLTIVDNFRAPTTTFEFFDLRPISLPTIPLSFSGEGEEIVISVGWQYSYFMPRTSNGMGYSLDL